MTDQPDRTESTAPDGGFSPSNSALAGVVVLGLMVLVAVLAVLAFNAEDDELSTVDQPATTAPTTMVPSEPEPTEPDEPGVGAALVGLTEAEVRERYPLVRVVELDGEPGPVTMDLQPGRINLALEDGVVVRADVEGCEEVGDLEPTWLQQACDPDPAQDGPDTFGKLLAGEDEGAFTLEVGTGGDQYFQGMAIVVDPDRTRVLDSQGAPLTAQDLRPDDVVWVWTSGQCAESSPVQCELDALVVDRPAE